MPDFAAIREDFPLLKRSLNGKPLVYLDSGATSQKPKQVIEALKHFYEHTNANIHRGAHGLGNEATTAYEGAREAVAQFIGASSAEEVVFTRNATESLNLVAQAWGRQNLKAGDEILISELEHHANWVPWAMIAKEKGASLKFLPLTDDGHIDLEKGKALFGAKTRILAFSWASNVLGAVNPIKELIALGKQQGALIVVDAAQAAPHFALNLKDSGADFAAFSAHKMLGPTGLGVLWGRKALLEALQPYQGGGSMIEKVSKDEVTYMRSPWRFEAGTPHIAGAVAFAEALKYLGGIGWEALQQHENALVKAGLARLSEIEGLRLYGPASAENRLALFSFNLEGANAQDVGALLDSMGLALRAGTHCAQPLMARYACTGMVRASFYLYNTLDEVETLGSALERARKMLKVTA